MKSEARSADPLLNSSLNTQAKYQAKVNNPQHGAAGLAVRKRGGKRLR